MSKELKTRVVMQREVMYEDGSGPAAGVAYDSSRMLGGDGPYIELIGVGEGASINVKHLNFVIEALQEVATVIASTK